MPDPRQRLRVAIVAVLDTAALVVALTGRASANIAAWNALDDIARPALLYRIVSMIQTGESGAGWNVRLQLTAIAEGNDADSIVEELLGAAEQELSATALLAAGVDAAPMLISRMDGDEDDQGEGDGERLHRRNLHVSHMDVELTFTE